MAGDSPGRPASVTSLAFLVLLLSVGGMVGLYGTLSRASLYAGLDLALPLWVLTGEHAVLAVCSLVLAWGLFRLRGWARLAAMIGIPVVGVVNVLQQIAFLILFTLSNSNQRSSQERDSLVFASPPTQSRPATLASLAVSQHPRPPKRSMVEPTGIEPVTSSLQS